MLHSPTRAFFPHQTRQHLRENWGKKKNVFVSKEEDQIQQIPSKVPSAHSCWTKAVVQGQRILFSLNYTSTPLKRKHRHCCSSHILLSGISRKPLTKFSCIYCALWRPESARKHDDLLWTRTGCKLWEKPTSIFFSARTFSVFLWAISTLGVMPQIPQIISL